MSERYATSEALHRLAKAVIPGGVDSPVRAFKSVGGTPIYFDSGAGSRIRDVDGNEYVDHVLCWGALAAGHAHPAVVEAIRAQTAKGTGFGAPSELETRLAERIIAAMPVLERVRFVNSGTEAVMSAVRLARANTGRDLIVKFAGCYHGHADNLLVQAGSGVATLGLPDSPGVTRGAASDTLIARYNDLASLEAAVGDRASDVAALLVEPVAGNMGMVLPEPGFLEGLRAFCDRTGALLIFDEVMTGFRVAPGGATECFGVRPDVVTLGKVIGGGLPVGAYAGSDALMSGVAPEGSMYQAGTLSGSPVVMAAGLATLEVLAEPGVFDGMQVAAERLAGGLVAEAAEAGVRLVAVACGSMFGYFFAEHRVRDYHAARQADAGRYAKWFHGMLAEGVYLAPSPFEAAFVSCAHTEDDVELVLESARRVLRRLADDR